MPADRKGSTLPLSLPSAEDRLIGIQGGSVTFAVGAIVALVRGGTPMWALKSAMADAGILQTVIDNINGDPADPVRIRIEGGAPVNDGDAVTAFIKTAAGYSNPQMASLLAAANALIGA